MNKKSKCKVIALIMALGMAAAGCGGASANTSAPAAAAEAAYDTAAGYASDDIYNPGMEAAETEAAAAEEVFEEGSAGTASGVEVQETQRKLIKNVNMNVETETFEELLATVEEKTRKIGGYIEESYTYNGSSYYGRGSRNASMTVRIPAEKLDEFLSVVSDVSNVISRNDSVSDVTLQYVDMESHKKALQAEQDRLLALLERAETIEDIINLESRLSEVRYQIESMESQLRAMDNQVSYSTVYLHIEEVTKLTPVREQTSWERISTGFANSVNDLGNGILNFGIGLIICLPYIVFCAVVVLAIILLIWLMVKGGRKRRQRRQQKKQQSIQNDTQKEDSEKE